MNIPKIRKQYIDRYGNTEKFDKMLKERNEKQIQGLTENNKMSKEEAIAYIERFDKMDEELDI